MRLGTISKKMKVENCFNMQKLDITRFLHLTIKSEVHQNFIDTANDKEEEEENWSVILMEWRKASSMHKKGISGLVGFIIKYHVDVWLASSSPDPITRHFQFIDFLFPSHPHPGFYATKSTLIRHSTWSTEGRWWWRASPSRWTAGCWAVKQAQIKSHRCRRRDIRRQLFSDVNQCVSLVVAVCVHEFSVWVFLIVSRVNGKSSAFEFAQQKQRATNRSKWTQFHRRLFLQWKPKLCGFNFMRLNLIV